MPCASGSLTSGNTRDSTLTTLCCPRGNSPGLSTRDTLTDGVFSSVYLVVDINCISSPETILLLLICPWILPFSTATSTSKLSLVLQGRPSFPHCQRSATERNDCRRVETVHCSSGTSLIFAEGPWFFYLFFCPTCQQLRAADVTDD